MKTSTMIDNLATDLRPVKRLPGSVRRTLYWLGPLLLASASLLLGLERPDTLQTLSVKLERLELVVAAITSVVSAFAAFSASKPDRPLWVSYLPILPLAVWIAILVFGVAAQNRPLTLIDFVPAWSCIFLLISFSLLPMITLTVMLRRAAPLLARRTAVLTGLASAGFAVVMLRLGLFHSPALMPEMLTEHIGSLVILVAVTATFCKVLLPRRSSCPGEY